MIDIREYVEDLDLKLGYSKRMNCPNCNEEMEEVEFSDGTVRPDGIPGVICFECNVKLTIDEIGE